MIDRRELFAIRSRLPHMLNLGSNWRRALFVQNRCLSSARANVQSSMASVISHVILRREVRHRTVVHVVNNRCVHVGDRRVVVKRPSVPIPAFITPAGISEAIIYTAIEADMRSPIAMVQAIVTFIESPIGRGPKSSDPWGNYPCAWRPVVAIVGIGPIAGRPDVVFTGARRLRIIRQRWRWLIRHNGLIVESLLILCVLLVIFRVRGVVGSGRAGGWRITRVISRCGSLGRRIVRSRCLRCSLLRRSLRSVCGRDIRRRRITARRRRRRACLTGAAVGQTDSQPQHKRNKSKLSNNFHAPPPRITNID